MRVIRVTTAKHFTQLHNATLRDPRISFRALGLLSYLLSLPETWRFRSREVARERPEGRDALRTAMNELETLGYVRYDKHQDERGHWITDLLVSDTPRLLKKGDGTSPGPEKPAPGGPGPIQNTEKGGALEVPPPRETSVANQLAQALISERQLTGSVTSIEWSTRLLDCLQRRSDLSWGLEQGISVEDATAVYQEWQNAREHLVEAKLLEDAMD